MFFNEDHLQITKPISINGMTPKIVDGKVVNRIVYLPLQAEAGIREENSRLPDGLKMTIRKMPAYTPPQQPTESDSLKIQLAELMAANAKLQKELTEKKIGRPKKVTA